MLSSSSSERPGVQNHNEIRPVRHKQRVHVRMAQSWSIAIRCCCFGQSGDCDLDSRAPATFACNDATVFSLVGNWRCVSIDFK